MFSSISINAHKRNCDSRTEPASNINSSCNSYNSQLCSSGECCTITDCCYIPDSNVYSQTGDTDTTSTTSDADTYTTCRCCAQQHTPTQGLVSHSKYCHNMQSFINLVFSLNFSCRYLHRPLPLLPFGV